MFLPEPILQRMQLIAVSESFDRRHLGTIGLYGEDRAGLGTATINKHSTSATLTRVAPDVGTGEVELLAQKVNE